MLLLLLQCLGCNAIALSMNQVAVAIPPSNDVDLFAHCAGQAALSK